MKGNRKDLFIMSMINVLLSCTLVAVASYALYSDLITINNHITSGNLKLEFKKVKEEGKIVNVESGLLEDYRNTEIVDLAQDPSQVFNIDNFVPCANITYTFNIKNIGTIAFDYYFSFLIDSRQDSFTRINDNTLGGLYSNYAECLMDQIELSLNKDNQSLYNKTLLEYYRQVDKKVEINSLNVNEIDEVKIKLRFINKDDNQVNNYVQNTKLSFDLNLEAVQKTIR